MARKWALSKNLSPVKWQRGSNRREGEKRFFWGAAVTNLINASFKSSTVPLQTILLVCEPSERKSKDTAAVVSELYYGPPCTLYVQYDCMSSI